MFEQAFKNIDDALWKESGSTIQLDYTGQTSWPPFLKYLDGLEQNKVSETMLEGESHSQVEKHELSAVEEKIKRRVEQRTAPDLILNGDT